MSPCAGTPPKRGTSPDAPPRVPRACSAPSLLMRKPGCAPAARFPGRTEERVWEFWPSDLQALFLRAGVVKPPPPPFSPECGPEAGVQPGRPPRIITPKDGVVYQRRLVRSGTERHSARCEHGCGRQRRVLVREGSVYRARRTGEPRWSAPWRRRADVARCGQSRRAAMQKIVVRTLP